MVSTELSACYCSLVHTDHVNSLDFMPAICCCIRCHVPEYTPQMLIRVLQPPEKWNVERRISVKIIWGFAVYILKKKQESLVGYVVEHFSGNFVSLSTVRQRTSLSWSLIYNYSVNYLLLLLFGLHVDCFAESKRKECVSDKNKIQKILHLKLNYFRWFCKSICTIIEKFYGVIIFFSYSIQVDR